MKNNLLCDESRYVIYLSPTEPGSVHDKKIADEYPLSLPEGSVLRQDSGFVGHKPDGVIIEQPFKKSKNKELTFAQKLFNNMLSRSRVVIEHANSGVKRLRVIKEIIRIHGTEIRDKIMAVACALHNLRVTSPMRRKAKFHVQLFSE